MIKAVIFDLDGTLLDSQLCFKTIRQQLGIPQNQDIIQHVENQDDDIKAKKSKDLKQIEIEAANNSNLFEGVLGVLSSLNQNAVPIGIFTRNCTEVVNLVINNFNLQIDYFLSREDAKPKPDPEGVFIFLNRWNLKPDELLFVGDSIYDIKCGKNANVKTALFTNGAVSNNNLGADFKFDHYEKFNNILKL